MLSFKQLQEKKTKVKINPKKDEIIEGQKKKKDDTYLEPDMKKRQANNEKARKELAKGPQMKNPHFESTNQEESAYDSQEEISEKSNQEIEAKTEIPFLTFEQYQYAKTLNEEQLNEFLGKLFGGGSKPKPKESSKNVFNNPAAVGVGNPTAPKASPGALSGVMTSPSSSQGSRSMMGGAGQAGAPMSKSPMSKSPISNSSTSGRPSSRGLYKTNKNNPEEKIKKEEVEQTNENILSALFGGGKKANASGAARPSPSQAAVSGLQNQARQGNLMGNGMIAGAAKGIMARRDQQAAMMKQLGYSKGGKVKNESIMKALGDASGGTRMSAFAKGGAGKDGRNYGRVSISNDIGPNTPVAKPPSQRPGLNNPAQNNTSSKFLPNRLSKGNIKKEEVENIEEMDAGTSKMLMKSAGKGPIGSMMKQGIKPGGGNPLGVQNAATSAGGGLTYTNNARLLARAPAQYTRGTVPEPPKTAPKVNSSANAVKPGMGSSSNNMRTSSSGPKPNRPVTSSNALRSKPKREHHLRSFGSFLNERTRYAKETGKDFTTGNPSEKGGEGRSEVGKHMQKVMRPTGGAMSSRRKAIQPQGKKKEKGAKPKFKTEPTPVDKIKNKLSRERAPKKDPYGYGQGRYQGD